MCLDNEDYLLSEDIRNASVHCDLCVNRHEFWATKAELLEIALQSVTDDLVKDDMDSGFRYLRELLKTLRAMLRVSRSKG